MNVRKALFCTALFCSTGALHAQVCSGGAGGGMDATGNECTDKTQSLRESIPVDRERMDMGPHASKTISG